MNTEVLRLLWSLVSTISPDNIAGLSNDVLVKKLLSHINSRVCLSLDEQIAVKSYLSAREPLVREIIQRSISQV